MRFKLFFLQLFLFIWGGFFLPTAVSATTLPAVLHPAPPAVTQVVFTDNFLSLDQWVSGKGNKSDWQVQDNWVTTSIRLPSTIRELVVAPQFWRPEWINYQVEFDYWPIEGVDRNLAWNYIDFSNWYDIHVVDEFWNVLHRSQGTYILDLSGSYRLQNGRAYKMKIAHWDDHIQLYINGQLIVDVIEPLDQKVAGRPALRVGTGAAYPTTVKFGNFKVSLLGPQLNGDLEFLVPTFKQTDPIWAKTVYDHATDWSSQPTIGRWGCAMTSLAMVFNYYGFVSMPDGSPLNPQTLNQWLNSQIDGYLGTGSVNWVAATRLIHSLVLAQTPVQTPLQPPGSQPLPDLEFSRWTSSDLTKFQLPLLKAHPVIGEIEGHFVVVRGFIDSALSDFHLTDPFYSFTLLSQHQTPLLGGRLYTPSHTDLSYWLIELPQTATFEVKNEAGQVMTGWETETVLKPDGEAVVDELDTNQNQTAIYYLAKPETGTYSLTVTGETNQEFTIKWLAYDTAAQVKVWEKTGWLSAEGVTAQLYYAKSSVETWGDQVNWQYSWEKWDQELQTMRTNGWFPVKHPFHILQRFAEIHAEFEANNTWPTDQTQKYFTYRLQVAKKLVQLWHYLLTDPAYDRIMQQIDWLEAAYAQIE